MSNTECTGDDWNADPKLVEQFKIDDAAFQTEEVMNLTAEHIDTIRWAYKNPDIDALADMAKRTLAAEAKLEQRNAYAEGYSEQVDKARAEGWYRDTLPLASPAAPDLVERLRNFPRFYTTDGIHWYKGDDKEPLCLEAAAALAEREKDAERYRYLREPREKMNDGRPFIAIAHIGGSGFSGWDETHADAQVDRAIADALRSRP